MMQSGVRCVLFSPDGRSLVSTSGGNPGETRLLDWQTGQQRCAPALIAGDYKSIAFSPDGRWLGVASSNRFAQVFDATTLAPHGDPLPHGGPVDAIAFSPDSQLLATADRDLAVRFWDPTTGTSRGQVLRQTASVQALAFSPDGRFIATAAVDGTIRLWDLATGLPCSPPFTHEQFATSIAFK